jgi:BASS family bile acid:Na+ symporter
VQGDLISSVLLPLILAFIMFSLGLGLTVDDFRRIFTQPRALLVGVVCHFVILPLACFGLLSLWGHDRRVCRGFYGAGGLPDRLHLQLAHLSGPG